MNYLADSIENSAAIIYNRGTKYLRNKNYEKAITYLKKSNKIFSTRECWLNLGACYKQTGRYALATSAFRESLALDNEYAEAWNNLGLMDHIFNREDLCIPMFRKAIELSPEYADAHWNLALSLLKKSCDGEFSLFNEAWQHYEYRFRKSGAVTISQCSGVRWAGEDLTGKRIMVLFEQGIGDNIMFSRYLPLLAKECGELIVQCTAELEDIFSNYTCVQDTRDYEVDYWVPSCSLAMYFNVIPSGTYISHTESAGRSGIGIVWQGSKNHANDKNRSVPRKAFNKFASLGLDLVSLQYGDNGIKSFKDTMALLNSLDFVIAVDTSIVHLAGAMGKKVFVLLPCIDTDFRWGTVGSECLWYPTVEIIRDMNFDECYRRAEEYVRSIKSV